MPLDADIEKSIIAAQRDGEPLHGLAPLVYAAISGIDSPADAGGAIEPQDVIYVYVDGQAPSWDQSFHDGGNVVEHGNVPQRLTVNIDIYSIDSDRARTYEAFARSIAKKSVRAKLANAYADVIEIVPRPTIWEVDRQAERRFRALVLLSAQVME